MSGEHHRVLFGVVIDGGVQVGVVVVVMVGVTLREGLRVGVLSSPSVGVFTVHSLQFTVPTVLTTVSRNHDHNHNHHTAEAKNSKSISL